MYESNVKNATIEDCEEMLEKKGASVLLNDGQVVGFIREGQDSEG